MKIDELWRIWQLAEQVNEAGAPKLAQRLMALPDSEWPALVKAILWLGREWLRCPEGPRPAKLGIERVARGMTRADVVKRVADGLQTSGLHHLEYPTRGARGNSRYSDSLAKLFDQDWESLHTRATIEELRAVCERLRAGIPAPPVDAKRKPLPSVTAGVFHSPRLK